MIRIITIFFAGFCAIAGWMTVGLAGAAPALSGAGDTLAEPDPGAAATELEAHAALQELKDRATVANYVSILERVR